MLNNRQQPGRRRGRGGQRQQGNGGRSPEQGNRIDNRARGNAPQMLEKYKTLARDSQMAGDRVMTEYYHQFADHYFRVVAETRARFEEQRRQRGDYQDDDDGYEAEERNESDDRNGEDGDDQDGQRDADPRRGNRDYTREQGRGESRDQGREQSRDQNRNRDPQREQQRDPQREQQRQPRDSRPRDDVRPRDEARSREESRPREEIRNRDDDRIERTSRPRRPREDRDGNTRPDREDAPATIDIAVLPPSFGSDGPITPIADLPMGLEGGADDAPAPKRRGRPRKVVEEADAS